MQVFPQPEDQPPSLGGPDEDAVLNRAPSAQFKDANSRRALEEEELEAALQLLVERAQYITGATGAALALPHDGEMVCRASAGSCAPTVGARLQVRSGLTGESIARRQLLRCDNAETDPRVNLETCRTLGIASIVVLPLMRANGEVRGLFELFSDHPYAFEERDLVALERMADLTSTALDLAEQRHGSIPSTARVPQPERLTETPAVSAIRPTASISPPAAEIPQPDVIEIMQPAPAPVGQAVPATAAQPEAKAIEQPAAGVLWSAIAASETTAPASVIALPELASSPSVAAEPAATSVSPLAPEPPAAPSEGAFPLEPSTEPAQTLPPEPVLVLEPPPSAPSTLPESMLRVRKCASCGFPISEGRTLCLDCEKKQAAGRPDLSAEPSAALVPAEDLPPFLANAAPAEESWLANHVNLLAILVLIVGILVAVVVFR